ncbi:MAG TPA: acyl-CoA dehydrogenase [Myxococcales bacterium]|jgi:alkylation response protein AidB-like acyl-CoA dehydrogenase|nr:acyl-CoA dehydrogenase [Myxococcales bacterium]HIM01504.1 acyl-CoA dehydrogenase [Myxococcales bacterium]
MYIGYDESQETLRNELRAYYAKLLTPDVRAALREGHGVGSAMRSVVRQMGEDGWLGIGWPVEYGGQGRSAIEQFIFFDESMRAGAPVPMLTVNTVGPTLYKQGSQEQKDHFLPRILKGDVHFCIGYTEPNAGTDLAALQTRAVADGDDFIINGQKVFTSLASDADYIWLATRTDPDVSKHAGLTMFLVDMKTPGITAEPMDLLSSHNICTTFFDNVRVPKSALVGELNKGWKLITGQLNHERVTICSPGMLESVYDEVLEWSRETKLTDGRRVIDQEWAQINLARVHAGLEFLRLSNWKVAWQATEGELNVADASGIKVFGTEWYLESFRLMMEIMGQRSYLRASSREALLLGHIETMYRSLLILTFGGGTNEIQRDLIGMFGLGLPRAPRF